MASPITNGFRKWVGFNTAYENPILAQDETKAGALPPPPSTFYLTTESGQYILTENGTNIEVEHL